jgi:hypothetical protein
MCIGLLNENSNTITEIAASLNNLIEISYGSFQVLRYNGILVSSISLLKCFEEQWILPNKLVK